VVASRQHDAGMRAVVEGEVARHGALHHSVRAAY
jgi:hypothetical protein